MCFFFSSSEFQLNNRKLHDQLRSLEKRLAGETALRQDLESEVSEKNAEISNKGVKLSTHFFSFMGCVIMCVYFISKMWKSGRIDE